MGCGTQIITKNNYIIMYTLKKCGVKTMPSKFHKLLQKLANNTSKREILKQKDNIFLVKHTIFNIILCVYVCAGLSFVKSGS